MVCVRGTPDYLSLAHIYVEAGAFAGLGRVMVQWVDERKCRSNQISRTVPMPESMDETISGDDDNVVVWFCDFSRQILFAYLAKVLPSC